MAAGDDAAAPPTGAAVLAVLADLRYWADRGGRSAALARGARTGQRGAPGAAAPPGPRPGRATGCTSA
jgi:hypothetical protein